MSVDPTRISVIGTGYLGATHAACMASLGHAVVGLDTDPDKVAALNAGTAPFFEPGLEALVEAQVAAGRLRFTTSYEDAAEAADVHFLCVGTPQRKDEYAADLTYVNDALRTLAPLLTRPSLVVGKSTVPAGTAARLARELRRRAPQPAVELAWNPEFLREGHAIADTLEPDRLVFGVGSAAAEATLRTLYAAVIARPTPVVVTDFATAELVKVSANAFLATKISFINAIAEICEATGADVMKIAEALSHDERIGGKFLQPGLGFGGGCLPKDIRAFMARAGELGVDQALTFLQEVDAINHRRRARVVDLAREFTVGTFGGTRIAVLGAAFKPNSDDIRDSPALDVASMLQRLGGWVKVYDPRALHNARRDYPHLAYADSLMEAVSDADIVMVLTEWDEFRHMDPELIGKHAAQRQVVDARNALDATAWRAAGWSYRALGRPDGSGSSPAGRTRP